MYLFSMSMHWDWDVSIVEFFNRLSESRFIELLFQGISQFGTETVFIVLLAITYYGISKKLAKDVAFPAFYAMCFGNIFKCFFNRFRPFQQYPDRVTIRDKSILATDTNGEYMLVHGEYGDFYASSSSSFPSGHSFSSSAVYTSYAYNIKKTWAWIVAEVVTILVMISRMALGAHFFTDVLAGFIIGSAIVILYNYMLTKFKNKTLIHIITLSIIGILTFLSPLYSDISRDLFSTFGMVLGFYIGSILEEKYVNFEDTKCLWKAVIRVAIGIGIAYALKVLLKMTYSWAFDDASLARNICDFLRYAIMLFTVTFLYPMLIKKCKFLNDEKINNEKEMEIEEAE